MVRSLESDLPSIVQRALLDCRAWHGETETQMSYSVSSPARGLLRLHPNRASDGRPARLDDAPLGFTWPWPRTVPGSRAPYVPARCRQVAVQGEASSC